MRWIRRARRHLIGVIMLAVVGMTAPVALAGGPTSSPSPSGGPGPQAGLKAQALTSTSIILPRSGTIVVQTLPVYTAASIDDLALAQPFL